MVVAALLVILTVWAVAEHWPAWLLLLLGGIIPDLHVLIFNPFGAPLRNLRQLASRVWRAIRRTTLFFLDVIRAVARGWIALYQKAGYLFRAVTDLAEATYAALRWIYTTFVPRAVRRAVRDALRFAGRTVERATRPLRRLVSSTVRWVRRRFATLWDRITKVRRWLQRRVDRALNWISRTGRRVSRLLTHPSRLVRWILPALVLPLVRWILAHLDPILRWAWPRVARLALQSVLGLERALARLI